MKPDERIALEQLEQARPHRPACQASDFAADKLRVLEGLEEAGAAGLTTRELMDRGGGMRPPNRIHDLREEGIAIKTVAIPSLIGKAAQAKSMPREKTSRELDSARRLLLKQAEEIKAKFGVHSCD